MQRKPLRQSPDRGHAHPGSGRDESCMVRCNRKVTTGHKLPATPCHRTIYSGDNRFATVHYQVKNSTVIFSPLPKLPRFSIVRLGVLVYVSTGAKSLVTYTGHYYELYRIVSHSPLVTGTYFLECS